MDGFVLTIWVVRLLFLALALRVPVRRRADAHPRPARGRAGAGHRARPPRRRRLAGGRADPGRELALDAITTLGRDVNNAIVVDDQFASAEHAVLTFRGRTWYVEDLGSTNGTFVNGVPVEGVVAARLRRRAPAGPGPDAPRATAPMTAEPRRAAARHLRGHPPAAALARAAPAHHRRGRDHRRQRLPRSSPARIRESGSPRASRRPSRSTCSSISACCSASTSPRSLTGRRTDQVLLPAVGLLGGISLLLMERLPQDLVVQHVGSADLGLADVQLVWLVPLVHPRRGARDRRPVRPAGCASTSTRGPRPGSGCCC